MSRPRIRSLKPEVWHDARVMLVSRDARLLFVALITLADDEGRMLATPAAILGHAYPSDTDAPRKLEAWLQELEAIGLAVRYQHGGLVYLWLPGWGNQRINKPNPSKLPAPPVLNGSRTNHGSITEKVVTR